MTRQEVEALARSIDERELPPEEFNRLLRQVLADEDELDARAALVSWFLRRYPTARERLAYARRQYRLLVESPLHATVDGDRDVERRG